MQWCICKMSLFLVLYKQSVIFSAVYEKCPYFRVRYIQSALLCHCFIGKRGWKACHPSSSETSRGAPASTSNTSCTGPGIAYRMGHAKRDQVPSVGHAHTVLTLLTLTALGGDELVLTSSRSVFKTWIHRLVVRMQMQMHCLAGVASLRSEPYMLIVDGNPGKMPFYMVPA